MDVVSRTLALVSLVLPVLAVSANGDVKATERSSERVDRAVLAQASAPAEDLHASDSAPRSPGTALGDLSGFRALVVDALRVAETGNLRAARSRVEALEESWQRATPKMKPLAPDQWKTVDRAIDRAERELRFWRVRRTDSVEALRFLLSTIDSIH